MTHPRLDTLPIGLVCEDLDAMPPVRGDPPDGLSQRVRRVVCITVASVLMVFAGGFVTYSVLHSLPGDQGVKNVVWRRN